MSFLKIDNLSVNYEMRRETVYAAKNINISLKRGEILGLVGESGSGKRNSQQKHFGCHKESTTQIIC